MPFEPSDNSLTSKSLRKPENCNSAARSRKKVIRATSPQHGTPHDLGAQPTPSPGALDLADEPRGVPHC